MTQEELRKRQIQDFKNYLQGIIEWDLDREYERFIRAGLYTPKTQEEFDTLDRLKEEIE